MQNNQRCRARPATRRQVEHCGRKAGNLEFGCTGVPLTPGGAAKVVRFRNVLQTPSAATCRTLPLRMPGTRRGTLSYNGGGSINVTVDARDACACQQRFKSRCHAGQRHVPAPTAPRQGKSPAGTRAPLAPAQPQTLLLHWQVVLRPHHQLLLLVWALAPRRECLPAAAAREAWYPAAAAVAAATAVPCLQTTLQPAQQPRLPHLPDVLGSQDHLLLLLLRHHHRH